MSEESKVLLGVIVVLGALKVLFSYKALKSRFCKPREVADNCLDAPLLSKATKPRAKKRSGSKALTSKKKGR